MSGRSSGAAPSRLVAVLGPTNTGKTHLAVERMLGHASGMIGLPLRLLAREIYDRVVKARGVRSVALITGEEKIVPPRPQYYVATVEAMPLTARSSSLPSTRSSWPPIPSAATSSPTGCCTRAARPRPCFWARRPWRP